MTKKLLFNRGGMPLYLEDLEVIQNQIIMTNRMNAIYVGLHPDDTIQLTGSALKGTHYENGVLCYTGSEGYLQYKGEIYYMDEYDKIPVKPTSPNISDADNRIYIEFRQEQGEYRMHNDGVERYCQATLTAHFWTYDEMVHKGCIVNNKIPDNFVLIDNIKIKGKDF